MRMCCSEKQNIIVPVRYFSVLAYSLAVSWAEQLWKKNPANSGMHGINSSEMLEISLKQQTVLCLSGLQFGFKLNY